MSIRVHEGCICVNVPCHLFIYTYFLLGKVQVVVFVHRQPSVNVSSSDSH